MPRSTRSATYVREEDHRADSTRCFSCRRLGDGAAGRPHRWGGRRPGPRHVERACGGGGHRQEWLALLCPNCRGLFAGKGTKSGGVCPAGGSHQPVKAYSYLLLSGLSVTDPNLFKNWFQCKKCRGLFADDRGDTGVCPKGGAHAGTGPAYDLWAGTSLPFMEANWRECLKCSGLYWAGSDNGVCPTGAGHQPGADVYTLIWLL
jgi:hypothetical protein